jgi:DNA repair protein RadD
MKLIPRDYQIEAHDAVIENWKKSTEPCLVEAATGAGKSLIVAIIAKTLFELSRGKRVLCLAPSKELIEQNAEKYRALGLECSIYSASISKSLRHQVVFATEGTFKKVAKRLGHEFAGVIIDEAHRITPTIISIIEDMREGCPQLRVAALGATPYRMDTGYIYAIDEHDRPVPEWQTRDPYFKKLVYRITAQTLIERGFLIKPEIGAINASSYDTSGLELQKNGKFTAASVERAFVGWGRETSAIVGDIVAQSAGRKGVMIFAATVRHAEEIMASLPPENSRMIGGDINSSTKDRERFVRDFKAQRFKYAVSVGMLTTGFDATHVDLIAILRATESVGLLQQIIGRGMRISPATGKTDCIVLDYAGNIERHCPDGDIFAPEIKAARKKGDAEPIEVICEDCGTVNLCSPRQNDEGFSIDKHGYFVDLAGDRILVETPDGKKKPMPAHYSRRCSAYLPPRYEHRCAYSWSAKDCPACGHKNDIAARFCESCREELVNPNDKLVTMHKALKRDPRLEQTDEVVDIQLISSVSRAGNEMYRAEVLTTHRKFTVYLMHESKSQRIRDNAQAVINAINSGEAKTVTYQKNEKDFYEIMAFNRKTDDEKLAEALNK